MKINSAIRSKPLHGIIKRVEQFVRIVAIGLAHAILKMGTKIKRRVVCVSGKFEEDTDFVLEPACSKDCNCEVCKDSFWIYGYMKNKNGTNTNNKRL